MKKLIHSVTKKDFDITFFSGTGADGQHRNKHMNCVRIVHKDSKTIATGQNSRSKERNLRQAFNNCINSNTFKTWQKIEISRAMLKTDVDAIVVDMMKPENLKIETFKAVNG